jgi:predicted RNA binding protein YcfA (HicA-like mRNA interferase family)
VNPPLPVVSGADEINALVDAGFARVGQRGSHMKLRKAHLTVIVPLHKQLAAGTLRSIIRQSEMSVEEFLELL